MPTPVSGLPISFSDIQTEFGGANPIGIEEYYQNAAISYTSGVTGIPNVNAIISIDMFYGKSKPAPPPSSSYPPAAVETNQATLGTLYGYGNSSLEWITGASGTNLTRTGGSTFNNIGAYGRSRVPSFANNQNLILQAKPGDTLSFTLQTGVASNSDPEVQTLHLHLGSGWYVAASSGVTNGSAGGGFITRTHNITLSASLAPGNYGIIAHNDYSSAGSASYGTGNFYSLHVVA
jgi:hypothetical protein